MSTNDESSRREYFRVQVPDAELIELKSDKREYRVLEISEHGVKLACTEEHHPEWWIRGTMTYDLDRSMRIISQVMRCDSNSDGTYTIVARVFNLTMAEVVAFQTYLVRRYGRGGLQPEEAASTEAE